MPGGAIALLVQEGRHGLAVLMVGSASESKLSNLKSQHSSHILMLHISPFNTSIYPFLISSPLGVRTSFSLCRWLGSLCR